MLHSALIKLHISHTDRNSLFAMHSGKYVKNVTLSNSYVMLTGHKLFTFEQTNKLKLCHY
jgi:hypothetical protein